MGLFYSHTKPGPGVDPNAPEKKSFFRFFDIFFRKFNYFMRLNLLYAVAIIPTFIIVFLLAGFLSENLLAMAGISADSQYAEYAFIVSVLIRFVVAYLFAILWGMGPVTAGITYILRNYAKEQHAWIWSDFKETVKKNWKQSLCVFLIDCAALVLFTFAFLVYGQMSGLIGALRYVMAVFLVLYTLMHFYIYPMMVTFELKLKDIYRNALLFAVGKLPSNLFVLAVLLLIHLGGAYMLISYGGGYAVILLLALALLESVILLSFSSFLINFNTYPKMKKYMLDNQNEQ